MNFVIPFMPTEEARLSIAARQSGLEPAELIKRLTLEHLPLISTSPEDGVAAPGLVVATTNPAHLSWYVPADLWTNIRP